MKDNYDELAAQFEKLKEIPEERRATNRDRIGKDHTGGKDVTPEKFQDTFGFRGVQFGNYVEGARRQEDLNNAYNALVDLANLLNIPTKAISLNGELGLAFGARGSGKAMAHYERGQVVINLTKTKGSGTFAHEWLHALDNYFGKMLGKEDFITDNPNGKVEFRSSADPKVDYKNAREESVAAFRNLVDVIRSVDLQKRSAILDQLKTKPYWSTIIEMSARAFESYVVDRLESQGVQNDYLVNFKTLSEYIADTDGNIDAETNFPYPIESERQVINDAFDNLFQTLKTKETDKGVALYSKNQQENPDTDTKILATLTGDEIQGTDKQSIFESARKYYQNKLPKSVKREGLGVVRISGKGWNKTRMGVKRDAIKARLIPAIPDIIKNGEISKRQEEPNRDDGLFAFYHITGYVKLGDTVYQAGVTIAEDKDGNLFYNINHDTDKLFEKKKAQNLLRILARGKEPSSENQKFSTSTLISVDDGVNLFYKKVESSKTGKKSASLAELPRSQRKIADSLIKQGALNPITNAQALNLLQQKGVTKFSKSNMADMWYSQMRNFLADKLNNTATPDTIKNQVQAWAKKGLFKQEELEWSGLLNWLDTQTGKISKNDVLQFLDDNQIQIEEIEKSASYGFIGINDGWETFDTLEEAQEEYDALLEWIEEESIQSDIDEDNDIIKASDSNYNDLIAFKKDDSDPDNIIWQGLMGELLHL